jgi:hypothetical protein
MADLFVDCSTKDLAHLTSIVDRATKKTSTPRFLRSIKKAVTVARAFGTGGFRLEQK